MEQLLPDQKAILNFVSSLGPAKGIQGECEGFGNSLPEYLEWEVPDFPLLYGLVASPTEGLAAVGPGGGLTLSNKMAMLSLKTTFQF